MVLIGRHYRSRGVAWVFRPGAYVEQSFKLVTAAHAHAASSGLKVTVALVDERGLLKALGRIGGARSDKDRACAEAGVAAALGGL
jgi:uncharacterized protein GlcG (DUF336 family)